MKVSDEQIKKAMATSFTMTEGKVIDRLGADLDQLGPDARLRVVKWAIERCRTKGGFAAVEIQRLEAMAAELEERMTILESVRPLKGYQEITTAGDAARGQRRFEMVPDPLLGEPEEMGN